MGILLLFLFSQQGSISKGLTSAAFSEVSKECSGPTYQYRTSQIPEIPRDTTTTTTMATKTMSLVVLFLACLTVSTQAHGGLGLGVMPYGGFGMMRGFGGIGMHYGMMGFPGLYGGYGMGMRYPFIIGQGIGYPHFGIGFKGKYY